MTEEEQLKENTKIQAAKQQAKEISEYLHELLVDIEYTSKRDLEAWAFYTITWMIWVGSGFFQTEFSNFFAMLFFLAFAYSGFRGNLRVGAIAEFRGAVKILRVIGMLPPPADPVQNKSHFWEEGKELVRAWMHKKQKIQGEVYA